MWCKSSSNSLGTSYDSAGNRTSKTNYLNSTTENYSYDALYQLTQVMQGSSTTESYSYDTVGNRLSSLGMSPYSYNSSNQLTATPSATYTYDYNGNTTSKTDSSGTTTYNWNAFNQLTSVVLPGAGGTVSFKYDPFGRRVQKSGPNGTVDYVYDGMNLLAEADNAGNALARYSEGPGVDQPLAQVRSGGTDYYEADGLGSISSLSNSAPAVSNTYSYDSFGRLTASTGSIVNSMRYTGRELDAETGLYYYRARYYDPGNGRFLSEDPIGFDGGDLDLYPYVGSNPVNKIDPSGRQMICPFTNPACVGPGQHLSDCVRRILQPYFPGLDLSAVVLVSGLPGFTDLAPIEVGAITWNGTMFYQPGQFSGDAGGIAAIAHELTHVQQQNSGLMSFLGAYLGDYLHNLSHGNSGGDAYSNIEAETQANQVETHVLGDLLHSFGLNTICKDYCK